MKLTAIFGGTFNPFHIGHYQILEHLCSQSFIEKVFVVPDRIPPHKECDYLAPDESRIEMCRLMCDKFPKAELCLVEFERKGKSYTYDTLRLLKEKYPDTEFAVVCGGDMIATLDKWYKYDKLKRLAGFIAFNRDNDGAFMQNVSKYVRDGATIFVLNKAIAPVSSTELRKELKKDKLPEEIYDYITKTGLYNG